ncbi:hypothetical protein BofuT4_P050360.1 [Botrytis cinerea T4]|uniref:Uncharacterized protein n=1 Tax=Botryotinia fuckeliana (strain T4) TaxID=999810 RepID=G2XZY1_BOTF4|nr:hypothetical protein BofuT4_P050360.1 [Botrytis cinerea T4]
MTLQRRRPGVQRRRVMCRRIGPSVRLAQDVETKIGDRFALAKRSKMSSGTFLGYILTTPLFLASIDEFGTEALGQSSRSCDFTIALRVVCPLRSRVLSFMLCRA